MRAEGAEHDRAVRQLSLTLGADCHLAFCRSLAPARHPRHSKRQASRTSSHFEAMHREGRSTGLPRTPSSSTELTWSGTSGASTVTTFASESLGILKATATRATSGATHSISSRNSRQVPTLS